MRISLAPGSNAASLGCMPVVINAGQSLNIAVGGDGFVSGMTTFDVPNPSFRRVSNFSYAGNYVYATYNISPTAPQGSLDVLVTSGNESAALTGALRVINQPRSRVAR